MKKLLLTIIFIFLASQSFADEIPKGISKTDFDDDGVEEIIVKGWRGNSNAHGFYGITFYKKLKNGEILLIPIESENDHMPYREMIFTEQGADCITIDYWILEKNNKKYLLKAKRKTDNSYVEKNIVTFNIFSLIQNKEGIPGLPDWYFKMEKSGETKKNYCDVNDAFTEINNSLIH